MNTFLQTRPRFSSKFTWVGGLAVAVVASVVLSQDASAQGYRYGIQSNGFDRGGSSIISQRGGLPQNNYTVQRPAVTPRSTGSGYTYTNRIPRRVLNRIPTYGYGGYSGYGYRSYGYGYVPGSVSGTGFRVGPGGTIGFGTGTYYVAPGYYGVGRPYYYP
ncbi:hypothetical protein [Rhodopirellula halodulae]|uniref:hypothetical protein n=1 Tax=Rhodopirellula halodulae TaxID=2894198 RepID=UPI001E2CB894|nr:hypothetical protein [Rhodopirellula sp. JC737]MCC9656140.1 hypothetical protein [Rhodopirellula sp. JC737]